MLFASPDEETQTMGDARSEEISLTVDVARERYPFCIVWTPIPCLTWLLPFVGHMGIANSKGVIYDFAGPYTITVDQMSFGATTRYIQLFDKNQARNTELVEAFDSAIMAANTVYEKRMHNLCCDNCHSHVAMALNRLRWKSFGTWNMVFLAAWMFFCGRFVSFGRAVQSLLPSILLYGLFALTFVL
mmetsp:Transcript_5947/g.10622  ORF Transcript_5947/g.10622 Transcript_5947/m.10622 type:complete len:187 (-) Transcript_5947:11-571(-)